MGSDDYTSGGFRILRRSCSVDRHVAIANNCILFVTRLSRTTAFRRDASSLLLGIERSFGRAVQTTCEPGPL